MVKNGISAIIAGVGKCLPKYKMTNEELSLTVDTSDEWIRSHTGISSRYIVTGDETCLSLAAGAGREALQDSGVAPEDIDLVIVATASQDFRGFPSTACMVQDKLGLTKAWAFDLAAACSGFSYALEVGRSFIASGTHKHALIIGADVLTSFLDWDDRSTCVLFGDGAGAAVLSASHEEDRGVLFSKHHSDGSGWDALVIYGGGSRRPVKTLGSTYPLTSQSMPRLGDWEEQRLVMDGHRVYNFAVKAICDTIEEILAKAQVEVDDLAWIIPHQANIRIIQAASKRLQIPIGKFYINIEKYANTSAATIPISIAVMKQEGLLKKGDKLILAGFGSGLTSGGNYIIW